MTWAGAGEVAAELGVRGWTPQEFVLMARRAVPTPAAPRVEIVDEAEVHAFWERSWRSVLPLTGRDLDRVVGQLVDREHLNDEVVAVTDLIVREAGRVVAAGQLRVDGATAAVDSVLTDPDHRGRGHADAILARAVDLAAAAGCDLVVLEAVADDWPRHWYARRGFEVVGSVWEVLRPA
jgi:GNAT superfamily N-acetyltransferase